MFPTDSSGNLLADRRYALAQLLHERGEAEAAADLIAQAEELAPLWPPLPFRRGEILMELGRRDEALAAFKTCLNLDPEDRLGAVIKLVLLGAMPQPDTLPVPYVEALFDDYAPRFDAALVETLDYRVPQLLAEAVEARAPRTDRTAEHILDIGCGTGLSGEAVYKRAAWLQGFDLSAGMLEIAQAKGVYNALSRGDILELLERENAARAHPCDLILAADVFVYLGDLAPVFRAVSARLRGGGLFAFSVQKLPDEAPAPGYRLGEDHRYAHSRAWIEAKLVESGLSTVSCEEKILRRDRGIALPGYILLAEKPRGQDGADSAKGYFDAGEAENLNKS